MKKLLLLLFLYVASIHIYAQEKIEITGQVKDAQTKDILEFCSVAVFNSKDSLITGAVTDEKGFFLLSLNIGYYHLIINYIGYKTDTTEDAAYTENKFIGVFRLEPDQQFLKEISITTSSHDNLVDKDVQIVTDVLRKGASDAKSVLDKLNGVEYDRFNNSIKVDNDSKVIILVDGMQKDQEYIKNLPPERLKKIEVIRSPSGRYALEGYSAVINIILKKDYKGMEFALFEKSMLDPDSEKKQGVLVQNNGSVAFSYVYNKLNVYAKYNKDLNNFNILSTTKKEYNNGITIERNSRNNNERNLNVKELTDNYTFGGDYYLNPKHTISIESNVTNKPYTYNTTNAKYDVTYTLNGNTTTNFAFAKTSSNTRSSYNYLFYEGKIDENNIFNSSFTYSTYKDKYTNSYIETSLPDIYQNGIDNKNSTKFYLEYLHTFKNKTSLQIGYGNTWEKLFNTYFFDTLQSTFNFTDLRHKLYSYYSWQKKKFSLKIGAAGETSDRNIDGLKKSFVIFQPYTDLQYKPSEKINFKLKYRTSSNYPNIAQISPFTSNIDLQSIQTGNPLLRPEATHKISFQTNIMNGLFSIEPYYHLSNNYITQTGILINDSIFEYNYNNIGNYDHYGFDSRFTIPFSKSMFLESDIGMTKSTIKYGNNINSINNWIMSSQFIYVRQKQETVYLLKYQKNLIKYITAQGYNKGDNDFWILMVQQPFFKKKLNVMLLYFLPINFGVDFNQGSYIRTNSYSEIKSNDISFLKNMFLIEVNFRFNKGKSVDKTEKQVDTGNEKNKTSVF